MDDAVKSFFSAPNEIDPSGLPVEPAALIQRLLARLEGAPRRTLLPARVGGETRWYGIAPSDREMRLLREELRGWLGSPLSSRTCAVTAPTDETDSASLQICEGATVIRVDIVGGWQSDARENVVSLEALWALAPERGVDRPRPVGRLLRLFYESILAADRDSADAALEEIRARSLLSSSNIRFLRVGMIGQLGTPTELRDDPMLRGVSLLARPQAVTEHLARAANTLFIESALKLEVETPDWTSIASQLEESWPALVAIESHARTRVSARCFALSESLSSKPRLSALRRLATEYQDDPVIEAITKSFLETPSPAQIPDTAFARYHSGDFEGVLGLAENGSINKSTAVLALSAAANLGDVAAAVRALAIVDCLSQLDREELLSTAVERVLHDQLLARTANASIPVGWLDWLRSEWPDRPDLLAEWAQGWRLKPQEVAAQGDDISVELLDALNDHRRARVRNGLPVLTDWLFGEAGLHPTTVLLATTLFDIMLSSEPGRVERRAALVLLDGVLAVGCSANEYTEVINAIAGQLRFLGPRDASWLAQCLDLLLLSSSPDPTRRQTLFAECLGTVQGWSERLDSADGPALACLFKDAGLSLSISAPTADDTDSAPTARPFNNVFIYSLMEGAARSASRWIKERWPTVEIRTSSQHVASDSLASTVQASDVVLVQTSHAKHSATQAIGAAVTDSTRVVLVHGRGATALFRALIAWTLSDRTD